MSLDADTCCRILPAETNFMVTHEPKHHRSYLSTTAPYNRDDYHTIKEALIRANSEECAAGDAVILSNNKGYRHSQAFSDTNSVTSNDNNKNKYVRSTVVARAFQIHDSQSRGFTRRCHLLFVVSERFTAIEFLPDIQKDFQDIISSLKEKAQQSYDSDLENNKNSIKMRYSEDIRFYSNGLRSPPNLLLFDTLHLFLHEK